MIYFFLHDCKISLEYYILKFHILIFFPDTHWFTLDSIKMVSRLTIPNRESLLFEGEGEVGIITLKFVTVISLEGKQGDAYKSSIAL